MAGIGTTLPSMSVIRIIEVADALTPLARGPEKQRALLSGPTKVPDKSETRKIEWAMECRRQKPQPHSLSGHQRRGAGVCRSRKVKPALSRCPLRRPWP